jgi:hypothetical protein
MRLAPRFVGASVFAPGSSPGSVGFYSDARAQLAKLYSLSKSYPGSDPESTASAVGTAIAALQNDVNGFTPWDSKFVTGSAPWMNLLSNSPVPDPSGANPWPATSASALNDAVFSLQTLVPTAATPMPAPTTARPVVTAVRPSAIAPTVATAPVAAPVTVIVQSPAATKPFPWSYVLIGAAAVAVGLYVAEEMR